MSLDFITDIFKGGEKQPVPEREDPEVTEAARRRRLALARASGRASTILTGPQGVSDQSSLSRSTLGPGG